MSAMVNHWRDSDVTIVALYNVENVGERNDAAALRDTVLD